MVDLDRMPPWAAEGSKLFRDIRGHMISVEKEVEHVDFVEILHIYRTEGYIALR